MLKGNKMNLKKRHGLPDSGTPTRGDNGDIANLFQEKNGRNSPYQGVGHEEAGEHMLKAHDFPTASAASPGDTPPDDKTRTANEKQNTSDSQIQKPGKSNKKQRIVDPSNGDGQGNASEQSTPHSKRFEPISRFSS